MEKYRIEITTIEGSVLIKVSNILTEKQLEMIFELKQVIDKFYFNPNYLEKVEDINDRIFHKIIKY